MPNMMKARYLRVKLLRLFDSRAGCPCGGGGLGRDEQEYTLANTPAVFARHGVFIAREVFDRV